MLKRLLPLLLVVLACPLSAKDLSGIYKKVNPAVVVLYTSEKAPMPNNRDGLASISSLGSGVLISNDGLVVTAAHVVQTAESVVAEFVSGEKVAAKVVSSLPGADLALLKLDNMPKQSVIAQMADSDQTNVGDQIFIIGAPYGIAHTLTVGYLSGRHQPRMLAGGFAQGEFFQTDAAINQGNSGGPMFNLQGKVIGIVSHIRSNSGGSEGLGFAVTSNSVKELLLERRPMWTGMEGLYLGGDLARVFNLPQENGVMVQRVAKNSPANRLGLRGGITVAKIDDEEIIIGGDVILSVQGIAISDNKSLERISEKIRQMKKEDALNLVVLRGGKLIELNGKL